MNCLREFIYNSKGETKPRKVFVLNADSSYVHGLDFALLSEDERKEIQEAMKDHIIHPPVKVQKGEEKKLIEGYKPEWNKAFRCFKRINIVDNEKFDANFNEIEVENGESGNK